MTLQSQGEHVGSVKILVADDSPTQRRIVTDSLRKHGYHVITAEDGWDALRKSEREQPALIVLDVVMPFLNGYEVCRRLKRGQSTSHIKVLMLTSKDQRSDKFWGLQQGADAYMFKPFEGQELLSTVTRLL